MRIIKYEEYLRGVVKWHCNKGKRRERWKLRVCRLRFRNNVPFCMISKRKKFVEYSDLSHKLQIRRKGY